MQYGHTIIFNNHKGPKGTAEKLEKQYLLALRDCQRIVKAYYRSKGGLSGFSAHTKLGQYGGLEVNGAGEEKGDLFALPEHFRQNFSGATELFSGHYLITYGFPYDVVVTACLVTLKHRLGKAIEIETNGTKASFTAGVRLAKRVTDLAIRNPIVNHELENSSRAA
jgi:hypothetical protein